jgi:hypothetical protein
MGMNKPRRDLVPVPVAGGGKGHRHRVSHGILPIPVMRPRGPKNTRAGESALWLPLSSRELLSIHREFIAAG